MARMLAVALAASSVPLLTSAAQLRVTPVEKVVQLLGKLSAQLQEEGATEAAEYDKFSCFCKHQVDQKTYQIEKSEEKIKKLTAKIEELSSRITALDGEVLELGQRVTALDGDIKTEKDTRQGNHETYLGKDKDVVEAIDAVEEAIEIMRNSKSNMKGDVELNLGQLTKMAGEKVALLVVAQNPHAYKYRSNDIIGTLESLKDQFKANKKQQDEDEFDDASASAKLVLGMSNEKKFKEKSKAEKEELSAELSQEKGELDRDKGDETDAMDADTDFRRELTTQCEDKAKEWDQRSKSRADELTALAEAAETLKSGVSPNYGANKKLVGLVSKHVSVPAKKPLALLQLGAQKGTELVPHVLSALAEAAKRLHSGALGALVTKVGVAGDHFVKVRGLIKDLVAKLEAEALSEADQKSFCDREMGKATANRDAQSLALEEAHAELVGKESQKAELLGEIMVLSEEIAELNKALMEATELRRDEKAANARTVAEAGEGKVAVQQAITVLEGYYNAFLQTPIIDREGKSMSDLAPKTSFSGDYNGNQEASKGILGLLSVILSDFERTETTVANAETTSQGEFEAFEGSTKTSISGKEGLVTTKEGEVESVKQAIVDDKDAIKTAGGLKASALSELEKLSSMCIAGADSYAERKAQREKEIEALKQAMQILDEWQA